MLEHITRLLTLVNETIDGEGSLLNTGPLKQAGDKTLVNSNRVSESTARFMLACTGITGTSMLVSIVTEVNGTNVTLASFTAVAAIGSESIVIPNCPLNVKVAYVETAITDFDCVVDCLRFVE